MADGGSSGIVDAALDAVSAVVDVAADEVKKTASQTFGQITGNLASQTNHSDPALQQRIQQDKIDSSQKEAALTQELRMIAHQNAQGIGVTREAPPQPDPQEPFSNKPDLQPLSSTSHGNTPLVLDQALRKTESGRNTKG